MYRSIVCMLVAFALCTLLVEPLSAAEHNPARTRPPQQSDTTQRFIVKLRATTSSSRTQTQASQSGESASAAANTERVQTLSRRLGLTLRAQRALTSRLHVMQVEPTSNRTAEETLAQLRAESDVEYAVLDRRAYSHATIPSDPLGPSGSGQWYLQSTQPAAVNATDAWDLTTGSTGVVVAVIDTGVRFEHEDLGRAGAGRLLPGYDFVSADGTNSFVTANDGDARDSDASDPGDWITVADNCGDSSDSSWHGTRVSGMIGALTNNSTGIAGMLWSGWILPVRVLGKCGGYNSDVLAGMLWAAGEHVDGVPDNSYPAKILNLSLGSEGSCDSATAEVVSQIAALGVLIVASAGNEGGPVDSPANCSGAMGILGLRHAGTKVGYSSLGSQIALAAPGGNCVNTAAGSACLYSLDTTSNTGTTTPSADTYTDQYNYNVGTSFSSPIVSGIAGLMLAVNGNLKSSQLIARLKEGASTFPTSSENANVPTCHNPTSQADIQDSECICTTSVCGAGMANALGAVNAALRPIAAVSTPTSVTGGTNITLGGDGSVAACQHTIASYQWSVVSVSNGATTPTIVNPTSATATVQAPSTGSVTVRLTVTDDAGKQDTADVVITSSSASTSAPASAGTSACLTEIAVEVSQLSVTATDASASEAGSDTGTFTLTRTGDSSAAMSVTVDVGGTAVSGTDYTALSNSVTFAAGAQTATLTVTPIDNTTVDGTRTVTITLRSSSSYEIGSPSSASVSIADNDSSSSSSSSGGGGGGGVDELSLLGLALAALARRARARSCRATEDDADDMRAGRA